MKNVFLIIAVFFVAVTSFGKSNPRILVFTKTAGFHHESIAVGAVAIQKLGTENKITVDTTSDAGAFTDANLKKYDALVFLSTTGDLFDTTQKLALQHFMKAGKGYVGIHGASDAEYKWPWYNKLVGGWFESHPAQQNATLNVVDQTHISTKHLPKQWKRFDEWYNFKNFNKDDVHVLITIDESSYKDGKMGSFHPMAWYHNFEGGRSFYTELGHTDESFAEPLFLQHILGGIQYAIGKK